MSTTPKRYINRTIIVLCAVSLFTDAATEMLYPVLPVYLKQIGFSVLAIGILEAVAEFSAAVLKAVAGIVSDRISRRNVFIQIGYSVSALAKPLIGLTTSPLCVFALRTADRAGKGIRTAPRDALLVAASDASTRGRVFGLHRTLDTTGAVIGPAIALLLLEHWGISLQQIFLYAIIPGVLAIGATFLLPREKPASSATLNTTSGINFREFFNVAPSGYFLLLIGFTALALINSSDLFILLRQSDGGLSTAQVVGAYCLYNFAYAALSYPAGSLSDKYGPGPVYISGLLVLAICYGVFSVALSFTGFLIAMGLYGAYSATTDGVSKAWLSNHIPKDYAATGLGIYQACTSFALLIASPLTGILWGHFGASIPFLVISCGTLSIAAYFLLIRRLI